MKISVIIVNFNGKGYLKECVNSVLKTDFKDFEVIVVDNGSTDGSGQGLSNKVKMVRSEENLFFTGGSNLGASRAKGEWLVFLNSDTVVDKNWLKELWQVAKTDKKLCLQPKIKMFGTDKIDCVIGKYSWPGFGTAIGRGKPDNYTGLIWGDYANGTCLMINKNWFINLGGFDESYKFFYEDVDLQLRARKQGGRAVGVMAAKIDHKGSLSFKQNVASGEVIFYFRRNRLITCLKNFSGAKKWIRWLALVVMSVFHKRVKMSLKALGLSLDYQLGEWFIKLRLKEMRQVVGKSSFNLLDLGCGDGKLVRMAESQGIKARGIDKKTGQIIEKYNPDGEKYEVISLYHVLEHLTQPAAVLKKIKTWLKPGGIVVIEVPLRGNLSERWLKQDYLIYWDKTHVNFWTKAELVRLVEQAGFKIIKKGLVWHQVFFHVITAKFKSGLVPSLVGVILWLPFKLLAMIGFNEEMIRLYLKKA